MGQHWTPQFLLRGFAFAPPAGSKNKYPQVWQYFTDGSAPPCKISIHKAAQSRTAFKKPVETTMSSLEKATNPMLTAMRELPSTIQLATESKMVLACYLEMFLWRRDPAVRTRLADSITPESVRQHLDEMQDMYSGDQSMLNAIRTRQPQIEQHILEDPNGLMADLWDPNSVFRMAFYLMSHTILEAPPTAHFTLPDSTIFVTPKGGSPLQEDAAFYLPLSRGRLLVSHWHDPNFDAVRVVRIDRAQVHGINKIGFGQAGRYVYASHKSDGLARSIRSPRRHEPALRQLKRLGPNPHTRFLPGLKRRHDDLRQHLCFVGTIRTGNETDHEWGDECPASEASESPDSIVILRRCIQCGAVSETHTNGKSAIHSGECHLYLKPTSNWWDSIQLYEFGGNRISARKRGT